MRNEIQISIPYPGDVISVNHYRGRRRDGGEYVKAEAQAWMDALGWMIKQHHIEDWRLPLDVNCDGVFRDLNNCPDLSNLSKCTLDAIEEVIGINDRNMRWHDGTPTIDKARPPELTITIQEAA